MYQKRLEKVQAGQQSQAAAREKRTKINACKINKQMHEKNIDQLSLFQVLRS